jgi:hypothetical protein
MSFRNILLGYMPLRELLREAEKLDSGTPFEKEAVNVYIGKSIRDTYGLPPTQGLDELDLLCKSETKQAFPNISDMDLEVLVKSRTSTISELARQIATATHTVIESFENGLLKKGLTTFEQQLQKRFSDDTVDQLIDGHLNKMDPSLKSEILKSVFEKSRGEKQE